MLTRTPSADDRHIQDFCRRVAPEARPRLLEIIPDPQSLPQECFPNVARKVELEGGRIVFGWAVWEWPGVYIEAEHHAVYESPQGAWIDNTPSPSSDITHRLFVRDDSAIYNFDNEGIRRDNQRQALARDPLIQAFFDSAKEYNTAMDRLPGFGEIQVSGAVARHIQALQMENARLTMQLAMKYTPRNARCFCGSGRKFKQCHGNPGLRT